eukprot:scaffold3415_cov368-Prasinococcus_capsulatus_cf.AAC.7
MASHNTPNNTFGVLGLPPLLAARRWAPAAKSSPRLGGEDATGVAGWVRCAGCAGDGLVAVIVYSAR